MHLRTKNKKSTDARRRATILRRPARSTRSSETPAAPAVPPEVEDELADERRLRESGGPKDRAMYSCGCGYVFEADVSTTVACPHCGAGQAW